MSHARVYHSNRPPQPLSRNLIAPLQNCEPAVRQRPVNTHTASLLTKMGSKRDSETERDFRRV